MLTTPIAIMIENRPGPSIAAMPIAISRPGIASMMSMKRMITVVDAASDVAGRAPSTSPADTPTATETTPMSREKRGAVEDARELVAPELVDAEQMIARRAWAAAFAQEAQVLLAWVVRSEPRSEDRRADEDPDEDEADDRPRVAEQLAKGVAPEAAAAHALDLDLP